MKYIKKYESFELEVGDWILYEDKFSGTAKELTTYTTTIPSKIIKIQTDNKTFPRENRYIIRLFNIPDDLKYYFNDSEQSYVYKDEVIAKLTEEEAELMIYTNKYNL